MGIPQIRGGGVHVYRLWLAARRFIQLAADSQGGDLRFTLVAPAGDPVAVVLGGESAQRGSSFEEPATESTIGR